MPHDAEPEDLRRALDAARQEAAELRAALHAVSAAYGIYVLNGTRGVHGPWRRLVDPTIYAANRLLRRAPSARAANDAEAE